MTIQHLDHLNMTVSNLQESIDWYAKVFGFEVVERGFRAPNTPWAILRSGESMLCLYEHADRVAPFHFLKDEGSRHTVYHFAFRITDREKWLETVEENQLSLEFGGVNEYSHSTSWYVTDPTGYSIEVVLWTKDTIGFPELEEKAA